MKYWQSKHTSGLLGYTAEIDVSEGRNGTFITWSVMSPDGSILVGNAEADSVETARREALAKVIEDTNYRHNVAAAYAAKENAA